MLPGSVENNWFDKNKNKTMHYNTGEMLAEVDAQSTGNWYYRNGTVALSKGTKYTYLPKLTCKYLGIYRDHHPTFAYYAYYFCINRYTYLYLIKYSVSIIIISYDVVVFRFKNMHCLRSRW